jgi:hypothetical protein
MLAARLLTYCLTAGIRCTYITIPKNDYIYRPSVDSKGNIVVTLYFFPLYIWTEYGTCARKWHFDRQEVATCFHRLPADAGAFWDG